MKRTVKSWRLEDLDKERARITFPEFQREKQLWSVEKKRLLIDSIMRDIDIPKLYFYLNDKKEFEVIDGQQRLWAIWDYFGDQYAYEINDKPRTFSQLNGEQATLKNYKLEITIIEEADEEYLREMFLRLQFGLLLNTGEKLHALSGAMKDYVFNELVQEPFITNLSIPNRRYARETLCAQICINSFTRAKVEVFARTRYEDLRDFFIEYEHPTGKNLTFFRSQSKRIAVVLHGLWSCFQEQTVGLRSRAYILSIYLLYEEIAGPEGELSSKDRTAFSTFIMKLWKRLREEIGAGFARSNQELYTFETYLSSASGERYQIERRHQKLKQYFNHFKATNKIMGD
jgi:hypothetical protein